MKPSKLQRRIFMAYLFVAVIVICSFSTFFYLHTSKILIERETEAILSLTSSFRVQTDQVIEQMDNVSINIGYSSLIKDKLGADFNMDVSRDDFESLANLFVTINGADTKVDQINLYDFLGNIISVGIHSTAHKVDDPSTLSWLDETLALNGSKLISEPYQTASMYKYPKNPNWFISLYRTYNNQHGKVVGAVETVKQCKSIFKNIISYSNKVEDPATVYVYSEAGVLMYPYQLPDKEESPLFNYFSILAPDTKHMTFENPYTSIQEIIAYEKSPYSKWTYVTVQPNAKILAPVTSLLKVLFSVSCLILAITLFISYLLTKGVTKPIKQLCHIIHETELHTLGTPSSLPLDTSVDEIVELGTAFENMSKSLKISMDALIQTKQQELQSRNLALQSQINPHFYHNTLSSIMILAENNDCDKVIKMCKNLSNLMRYITSTTSLVTVKDELKYLEEYLFCMKVRYQTSLDYTIQIHPELLQIQIPKLLIQPLVENAIKYGTNCSPPWHIKILSTLDEDCWTITVLDSGIGFTDSALVLMDERIRSYTLGDKTPESHIDGMGLLNVYCRWKLHCGESMIFEITNHESGGGQITLGKRR